VVVDADAAHAPFGENVRLDRQGLERRTIEFFEQPPARHAKPPDRPFLVETDEQIADRRLSSARLWKRRLRSRPISQRSTISTQASTFALESVADCRAC
jgi:hypothetical protein